MTPAVMMWEHHSWESPIRVGGRALAEKFLAAGWSVAYLNGPLAPWNLSGGNDEIRRRRASWRNGGEERGGHATGRLFTYTPLSFVPYRPYPVLDRSWFHRHSLDLTAPPLTRLLRKAGFAELDLLWLATGSPFLPLLKKVRRRKSLYRLSDASDCFPDAPRSHAALEEEAMRQVDLVVATAAVLAERARRFNRRVLLLPNGVDFERFANAREKLRAEAPERDGARVVYVGAIDSWFDAGRVVRLSRALPRVTFQLAGPVRIGTRWAQDCPNVHLTGPIPPEEVPDLLARSDVGIIPFTESPLTHAIHPVKLYEYLAAGLPVVASDLEEIRRIASPALLARDDAGWVDAVKAALERGHREDYPDFARHHDWSRRFADLLRALDEPESRSRRAAVGEGGR